MALHVDRALHAPLASVCARRAILVLQMISKKDASYVDNVTLIKIVSIMKFASNSVVAHVIAWMVVVNSHADRMHCAYRAITDRRVSVVKAMLVIQMILILVVNRSANVLKRQIHAIAWEIVKSVRFVW